MKNIKKILFPTDFSNAAQNAFRYCLVLADQLGASIELLHVMYPEYDAMDVPVLSARATMEKVETAKMVTKSFTEMGLTQVQLVHSFIRIPNIQQRVEIGSPVGVISRVARQDNFELIVMGTKGEHNRLENIFGSVTTGVIRKAPCHVWIIPEDATYESIGAVAYATDLNEADPFHLWKVGKLFEGFEPTIHCVHVNVKKSLDKLLDFANLEAFFQNRTPKVKINFQQIPGESILDGLEAFCEANDIDVLIMYAPHYDLLDNLFHTSQTRKMALETSIPLLVLKQL